MKKNAQEITSRIDGFSDSIFLADQLREMAEEAKDLENGSKQAYYLKECAIHIEGLFDAAMDLVHYIKTQDIKSVKKSKKPPSADK